MTVVVRQAMSDDTGVFIDGTVVNKAFVDQVYDVVDDQCHSSTNPTIKPKATTDEVIAARGSKASLDARLDVALNEDGTPKAVAGQATETEVSRVQGQLNHVPNGEMEFWENGAALAPRDWTLAGAGAVIARSGVGEGDTTTVDAGQYAAKVTAGGGAVATLTNTFITTSQFTRWGNIKGRKIAVSAQIRASNASSVRIIVDDGVTTTASSYHTGGGTVENIPVLHTVSNSGTKLAVYLEVAVNITAYVGGVVAVFSDVGLTNWIVDSTRGARIERIGFGGTASNSGTGETDLFLWSIPPFDIGGEGFRLRCEGTLAANTNTKTLRLDVAGQKLQLLQNTTNVASNAFTVDIYVARRTAAATTVDVFGIVTFNAASGAAPTIFHLQVSISSVDCTKTQLCKITGQSNTASSDLTLRNVAITIERGPV